jgi:hypothetical protein
MIELFKGKNIEIVASSGSLRMTIFPNYLWIAAPIATAATLVFGGMLIRTGRI